MLRFKCSPSIQLYLRSTVDTALRILRQLIRRDDGQQAQNKQKRV